MDVRAVEKLGVDLRLCLLNEAAAADGEDLADGVAAFKKAGLRVGPGSPDGVFRHNFDDDGILRHGEEMLAEILVAQAFLPDTPEHPLVAEGLEIFADQAVVLRLLVAFGSPAAGAGLDVFVDGLELVSREAPLTHEVEVLDRAEVVAETVEGEASGLVAEVDLSAFANVVGFAVSDDAELARIKGFLTVEGCGTEGSVIACFGALKSL